MKKLLNPIEKVILQKSRNKKNIESAVQEEWRFSDQHDFRHLTNSNRKTKCACNHGHPWYFYYCYNIYTNETIQLGKTCYNLLRNIKDKYIKNKTSIKKNKKKLNISTIMNLDDKSILYNLIINQYNLYERIDKIIMDNDFKKHIMNDIKNNNKYIVHKSKLKQFILYSNFYATNIQRVVKNYLNIQKKHIKQNLIDKTTIIQKYFKQHHFKKIKKFILIQHCFKQHHIKKIKNILLIQQCFKQYHITKIKNILIIQKYLQERKKNIRGLLFREKCKKINLNNKKKALRREQEKQKKIYKEQQRQLEKLTRMNRKKKIKKSIKAHIKNINQKNQKEFIEKQKIIALKKNHPYLINLDEEIELIKIYLFYKPCCCNKCRDCDVVYAIYKDIINKNIDSNDYSNIVNTVNTYFEQI